MPKKTIKDAIKEMMEIILKDDLKIMKKLKTWNKYSVQW